MKVRSVPPSDLSLGRARSLEAIATTGAREALRS
jgi:hypothetical protein